LPVAAPAVVPAVAMPGVSCPVAVVSVEVARAMLSSSSAVFRRFQDSKCFAHPNDPAHEAPESGKERTQNNYSHADLDPRLLRFR
jgi:hypothetical protein